MISVKHLNKHYGKKVILDNISFDLSQGEMVGLIGPNGVGKTTLMSILMGLTKADKGEAFLANVPNHDNTMYQRVGFMQDNTVLYPHLTGYDHLAYIASIHDLAKEAIQDVSELVGNESYLHQRVGEYSLGMKQHLLFACAIIHQPEVLLLDEPFNGLDPTSLIRIRELIMELNDKQRMTVLLSSHNLTEIDRMTSKIFFLNQGQIIHKELQEHKRNVYLIRLNQEVVVDSEQEGIEQITPQQLMVQESILNPTLERFIELGINIEGIDREQVGSERLYREIYNINSIDDDTNSNYSS